MKKKYVIYIILFLMICLIPSVGLLFVGPEESSENRNMAEKPALRAEDGWNTEILDDAGAWYEDHFAFRNEMVTAYAEITGKLFGVSSQDSVIVGKNNWLYYKDSLRDYQGTDLMTERQLFNVAHTLAMIQTYADENGIEFAFTIAPNKNSLYGSNMPYYYQLFRTRENNVLRIQKYLEEEQVHYVDLYGIFRNENEVLYHVRDSHWNNKGAAMAADRILSYLGKDHPSYKERAYEVRKDFEGDLDAMLYPAAVTKENEIYYNPQPQFSYCEEVESNFEPKISTVGQEGSGSLVMYRDSFGNALLPYMAEVYGNAYFSRGVPYQLSDLFACEADTLVIERAERFLPDMACNAPMMAAPLIVSDELENVEFTADIPDLEIVRQGAFTKITGTVPDEMLSVHSRIYIRVNGLLDYEAFPVSYEDGKEGFQLLVATETLMDEGNTFEMYVSPDK